MGIRIQPLDIEIPETDPFKDDLLGRKEPVKVLTHLIGSIEGSCVLAVDAAWGAGKTTFLKMWSQYLRDNDFPVVEFNAWETDFTGDPFIALSGEMIEGLRQNTNGTLIDKIENTKKAAKEIVRRAVPGAIRLATAGILDLSPMMEKEAGQVLASYAEERLSSYRKEQESVQAFKSSLQDTANSLADSKNGKPLVVIIDELDRCRPSYAIELLEVAKHLFTVEHIIFVLAVNRSELEHSICALYGSGFDAQGYLRRFFDIDLKLPEAERKPFIEGLLKTIKIGDYFARTKDPAAGQEYGDIKPLLLAFFDAPDLSLRRIAQAIHRLGLVFASLRSDQQSFALPAVVAQILRTVDPGLYFRFIRGEASDLEVIDYVFNRPAANALQQQDEGYLFEATVIEAAREIVLQDSYAAEPFESPLLQRHKKVVQATKSDSVSLSPEQKRAQRVIWLVEDFRRKINFRSQRSKFRGAVQRIELLSPSLVDKSAPEAEDP